MTAERARGDANTGAREPTRSCPDDDLKRVFKAARTDSFVETPSEEVGRLYQQLSESFRSNNDEAVRLIYRELLRLGRPRMEILAEAARAEAAEAQRLEAGALSESIAATKLEQPRSASVVHSQSDPRVLTSFAGDDAAHLSERPSDALRVQPDEKKIYRLPWLNVRTLFWLAPATCIIALGAAAGTAALMNVPRIGADTRSSISTGAENPAVTSVEKPAIPFIREPSIASVETPVPAPAQTAASPAPPNNSARHLTAEDVATLRARGDELLSTGDVTSGRLLYERAAVAGDAQAAIRLGATYDPKFISEVPLRGVRGDMAVALDWYRRARNLGAVEAEALLRRSEGE